MNKFIQTLIALVAILMLLPAIMTGQGYNSPIPIDNTVVHGKLQNGLTYYIKHNAQTQHKAELRLVLNVGSTLETDAQQGIAHFLEHMAFNGTKHFKKNDLIKYLESLGVQFGADLNAHTGFDETVYKLTLPTNNETVFDNGLQILRDWADGITLDEIDIDEERGVIIEEMRGRLTGPQRLFTNYIPLLVNDARHAYRFPIGKEDVVKNAPYSEFKNFYDTWYRPDLMSVIIVGDINVEETKNKIVEYFGGMEMPVNAKDRQYYNIPDHEGIKVGVFKDKEVENVQLYVYFKKEDKPVLTLGDYREQLIERLFSGMLNQRILEEMEKGEAPLFKVSAGIGRMLANKDAYHITASLNENNIYDGVIFALQEGERVRRFGFTQPELDRYKEQLLNLADLNRMEEGKINSRTYVEQYVDHFTFNTPVPGNEFIYHFYKSNLPEISLDEVNAIAQKWIVKDNVSLVLTGPESPKVAYPTEGELIDLLQSFDKVELDPYVDELAKNKIMEDLPKVGEILATKYNQDLNITELILENGVTVILKPTLLQNSIVNMSGFRDGGSSLAEDKDYVSARYAGEIINESGVNGISKSGINKLTMGKAVKIRPFINFYEELISGASATADIETLLQLTHLYFTNPNKDERVFELYKDKQIAMVQNDGINPSNYFFKQIAIETSGNHLRAVPLSSNQIVEELDLEKSVSFYNERFSSAFGSHLYLLETLY